MGSMWNPAVIAQHANMTLDEILAKSLNPDPNLDPDDYSDDDDEFFDEEECEETA